jgi:hypothetical protein
MRTLPVMFYQIVAVQVFAVHEYEKYLGPNFFTGFRVLE